MPVCVTCHAHVHGSHMCMAHTHVHGSHMCMSGKPMGAEISQCVEDLSSAAEADVTENANKAEGELAAGWLYARSSRSMQSKLKQHTSTSSSSGGMRKQWFVLRGWPECTVTSYKDRFSPTPTGVSYLLRSEVKPKQQEDDKFHFTIHHSSHGSKHLFAETSHGMHRWIQCLTDVVQEATDMGGMEGMLKKRGGIRLHTWQARWFQVSEEGGQKERMSGMSGMSRMSGMSGTRARNALEKCSREKRKPKTRYENALHYTLCEKQSHRFAASRTLHTLHTLHAL